MIEQDLQRWSREVAEDPGAPPFVRLARAYRRQGRGSAARDVVLAGLAARPEHVDAHALLALMHVESGERQQARDEWETVLRLDPGNFDASRGLGFLALERGELGAARRHLDTAARARPEDPAVAQARQVLQRREQASAQARDGSAPPDRGRDPLRLFVPLAADLPFLGALLFDSQGLVLAGRLEGEGRQGDLLGALLSTAVAEASRTAEILRLGEWGGLLVETAEATLHVATVTGGAVVVVVTKRDAPAGWVLRVAGRARELAEGYLEEGR